MNPWAMLGLLIVCVVAVTLWTRVWADIVSPGPERSSGMRDGQDWHRDA